MNEFQYLVEKNSNFWDFKDAKKEHIHGICTYPATMVPNMQSEILKTILKFNPNISNILDPFMGSGTTLVEGVINKLDVIGIDINPLAYLLSSFKVNDINLTLLRDDIDVLFETINLCDKYPIMSFKNINKWYKKSIIDNLSKIRYCIMSIKNKNSRRFLWICFAELSRLCNNSRNSTFKLHIKSDSDIENFNYNVDTNFKKIVENNFLRITDYYISYFNKTKNSLFLGNTKDVLNDEIKECSVDLIITSPPYGDNHTTVTYGQFSVLPLRWIDLNDIDNTIDEDLITVDNRIDTKSLGGKNYKLEQINNSFIFGVSNNIKNFYEYLIQNKEFNKARKFSSFFIDFYFTFEQMVRVLKHDSYMVLTVGNRRISNIEVKFNEIIKELGINLGLETIYEFDRNILNKRIPHIISRVSNNNSVKSMSKEYTLILKKK
ncbi:hypothetical protein UC77_04320 [Clostridium baratii]|nr:hypothetical protein UC77_04320 [Clostridium baratii]